MKKFILTVALVMSALVGSLGHSAQAAPAKAPTNLELLNQALSQVKPNQKIIFFGDMGVPVERVRAQRDKEAGISTRSAFDIHTQHWPGGRVPYDIDPALPQADQDSFVAACREWEKWANLKFFVRTTEANYIHVFKDPAENGASYSMLGMIGGAQNLSLAPNQGQWTAGHELGHALGLDHEHQRSDRDQFITINFDNVGAGRASQFTIIGDTDNHRAYDFDSIMHYGDTAFSVDGVKKTMVCKPGFERFQGTIGQDNHFSELDKAGMADIYGFPPGVTATPVPTPTLPPRPTLVCNPVTVKEGDSGTTPLVFHLGLSYAPTKDVSFSYKIVRYVPSGMDANSPDVDKYSAVQGEDYSVESAAEGSITMPAATTDNNGNSTREADITLSVIGDTKVENDESLLLVLSDPVNVRFINDQGSIAIKGTISNDDFEATPTPIPNTTATPKPTSTPQPTGTPSPTATSTPKPTETPKPASTPTARVSLSPVSPTPTSLVTANLSLWPSGQTTATLVWRINGVQVASNITVLNLARFKGLKRGDVVSVEVTPHRGDLVGQVATASVAVANTPPTAKGANLTTLSAIPVSTTLVGSDYDGDALSFAIITKPLNGTAILSLVDGHTVLTYKSKVGFIGTESIGIAASDGKAKSEPATIQVKVNANTSPQLVSLTPNSGKVATATTLNFVQTVSDTEKNITSVAFTLGASSTSADARGGVGLVYDPTTRTVSLLGDDGKSLGDPVSVGATLENSRAKVILRSVSTEASGVTTLRWQVTFKPLGSPRVAQVYLWAKVTDAGTLVDGFRSLGKIELADPVTTTNSISAGNS